MTFRLLHRMSTLVSARKRHIDCTLEHITCIQGGCNGKTKDMLGDEALMKSFRERIPLGNYAQPEDVAAAIVFLASDDARFITGVNLPVDGGLMASNGQPRQA